MRRFRDIALVVFLALAAAACTDYAPLDVAKVDLERFQGSWYEIAKLPRATQKDCTGTMAFYRRKSASELDVFNECREGGLDGPRRQVGARAVVTDPDEPGKLSLDFGGFFGDYWIVDLDPDYRFAAVGHPSRDYLWILSRTPSMPEVELTALVARVQAKGFDTTRLELTLQPDEADAKPDTSLASLPSPSDHGCELRHARPGEGGGLGWLLAAALVIARARRPCGTFAGSTRRPSGRHGGVTR